MNPSYKCKRSSLKSTRTEYSTHILSQILSLCFIIFLHFSLRVHIFSQPPNSYLFLFFNSLQVFRGSFLRNKFENPKHPVEPVDSGTKHGQIVECYELPHCSFSACVCDVLLRFRNNQENVLHHKSASMLWSNFYVYENII